MSTTTTTIDDIRARQAERHRDAEAARNGVERVMTRGALSKDQLVADVEYLLGEVDRLRGELERHEQHADGCAKCGDCDVVRPARLRERLFELWRRCGMTAEEFAEREAPLKAAVMSEDKVPVSGPWPDPAEIAARHGISPERQKELDAMIDAGLSLDALAAELAPGSFAREVLGRFRTTQSEPEVEDYVGKAMRLSYEAADDFVGMLSKMDPDESHVRRARNLRDRLTAILEEYDKSDAAYWADSNPDVPETGQ